jgi:glycosyltransferase involved in cell wall biosynthesis
VLVEEITRRVTALGVDERVTLINRLVDVNAVLAQAHATVALATAPGIIKAYPHSLLDSLAAGKPVLVSQAIPMADYVTRTGCGQVVDKVAPESILQAITLLIRHYAMHTTAAIHGGRHDFPLDHLLRTYHQLYRSL